MLINKHLIIIIIGEKFFILLKNEIFNQYLFVIKLLKLFFQLFIYIFNNMRLYFYCLILKFKLKKIINYH
jgi:hypothetical protein